MCSLMVSGLLVEIGVTGRCLIATLSRPCWGSRAVKVSNVSTALSTIQSYLVRAPAVVVNRKTVSFSSMFFVQVGSSLCNLS